MNVTRVNTGRGSHIEPPLNPDWPDLTKLEWKAAVVEMDTGLRARVREGGHDELVGGAWKPIPNSYQLRIGTGSIGPLAFRSAWDVLTGAETGARVTHRRTATDIADRIDVNYPRDHAANTIADHIRGLTAWPHEETP